MQYEISGGSLPVVTCYLSNGETMISESGGMCWMSADMEMSTNTGGGLMKGLGRMLAGDSLFVNNFTARGNNSSIAFASHLPGAILPYDVSNGALIVQKSAFLASEASVQLDMHFKKKLGAGLFGGEGFIMQKISGHGTAFLEIDGSLTQKTLAPGEELLVDTGYLAAYTEGMGFDVRTVKGVKNVLFGGESVFNTVMTGPGTVYLQSMPISTLAAAVIPFIPEKH